MATTLETRLQVKTLMPNITVNDIQKSVTFFEGLGFKVEERWEDKGTLNGVMLRAGEAQLGLSQDDWKKGRNREKGIGFRLFLSTSQKVDELAAAAKAAGITLDQEPYDNEWGRAFDVTEPSGFKLTIGTEK
jgi:predicted lactoylglutathione lyase